MKYDILLHTRRSIEIVEVEILFGQLWDIEGWNLVALQKELKLLYMIESSTFERIEGLEVESLSLEGGGTQ